MALCGAHTAKTGGPMRELPGVAVWGPQGSSLGHALAGVLSLMFYEPTLFYFIILDFINS